MSSYDESQNERVIANVNKLTRKRPDPPRGVRALAAGGIQWDPPISDAFTHYRVYANSDGDRDIVRQIAKGQNQLQDLTAARVFVSAYNENVDLESERVCHPAAISSGGIIDTSDFARKSQHNVFTQFQSIVASGGQSLLELQNTTPSTGALVWFWAKDNGQFTITMAGNADVFTFQVGGGLDYYAGRSGGVNLMTIRNGATDAYSGIDFMNDAGAKRAFIGWGNVSAPARANALGIGTTGAHEIIFVLGSANAVKFDTAGNFAPVVADTRTVGTNALPFASVYGASVYGIEVRIAKAVTLFATFWRFYISNFSGVDFLGLNDPTGNLRLAITPANFGFAGHLDPLLGSTYDIGSANNARWRDVRISGKFAVNDGITDLAALGLVSGIGTLTLVGASSSTSVFQAAVSTSAGGILSVYSQSALKNVILATSDTEGLIQIDFTTVLKKRKTGWSAPTGTATRSSFDPSTVTLPQLGERVKGLLDDLLGHGLIGA